MITYISYFMDYTIVFGVGKFHDQFCIGYLGYFLGGFLVDRVCEPWMARQQEGSLWIALFGRGKGSGAAFLFLVIAILGIVTCFKFTRHSHIWEIEDKP